VLAQEAIYIYIYIYIYVYIYICVCVCVCVYVYMLGCACACTYGAMCVWFVGVLQARFAEGSDAASASAQGGVLTQ